MQRSWQIACVRRKTSETSSEKPHPTWLSGAAGIGMVATYLLRRLKQLGLRTSNAEILITESGGYRLAP